MDAVAVEGQRRITEQKNRVGLDGALPNCLCGSGARWRRGSVGSRLLAVYDVLFLDDRYAIGT